MDVEAMGMAGRYGQLTGWRATMARWLLLCVVVRALIPIGFMPSFGSMADEGFHLVICTTDGAAMQWADPGREPGSDDQSRKPAEPCAFAGLSHLWQPVPSGLEIAVPAAIPEIISPSPIRRINPIPVGPQVGARAPPQHT